MARRKQTTHTEILREALAAFPEGASLSQLIEATQDLGVSRDTVIRRLADMVTEGIVTKSGKSRSARYALVPPQAETPDQPIAPEPSPVPLSKAAIEIRLAVRRPIAARKPVGYARGFLEAYRPNRTSYLSDAEKARLATLGRIPSVDGVAGTYAENILNRLLIDLAWNSSRLEGNTYSLLETERLIELGEAAEGKGATDAQMILNHKAAIEFLVQSAGELAFNRPTVLNLHALLSENLLADPAASGRLRQIGVGITGSVYHPLNVPQVIAECFDQILATAEAIQNPFEQAFFVMVQLPYLQPFDDVNKRTSRLAANIPLVKHNLSPLSFVDVPKDLYTEAMLGVYELNRIELLKEVFLWAYERSANRYAAVRQTLGEPDPFRLRYRQALKTVVAEVIRERKDKKAAARQLAAWAADHVETVDRSRFVEVAETELLNLHEGNFARYGVKPSEFSEWQAVWTRKERISERPKPKST